MRKTFLAIALSLLGSAAAMAQTSAVITNKESAASYRLTIGDVTYTIGILHGVKDSNTGADADASGAVNVDDVTKIANKVIRK